MRSVVWTLLFAATLFNVMVHSYRASATTGLESQSHLHHAGADLALYLAGYAVFMKKDKEE